MDDSVLLRQYVGNHSEEAFAILVARHVNLVYGVALRQVGNPHHAEEITQVVFIILAKKAVELRHDRALSSWLFQATRLTASNFVRGELRRQHREQEAFMQSTLNEPGNELGPDIAPLLDTAIARLNEPDRRAILLRFYEGRNLHEVGAALGASEDAAKKRVNRAVEKLRGFFTKRGVVIPAAVLTMSISANAMPAAPLDLAATVTATAVKGTLTSANLAALVKTTLKSLTWMKFKFTASVIAVLLITGGLVTVALSGDQPQRVPVDVIAFFKQALGSPPEVDSFIAGQRSLRPTEDLVQLAQLLARSPGGENRLAPPESLRQAKQMRLEQFYAGARAGSDYYVRFISSPGTPDKPADNASIIGRAGSVLYQVGNNNVSYGSGTNAFVASVDSMFVLVRQFLNLGLGDVEPESVVWTGNQFTALNRLGKPRYGELEISNGLPFAVNVSGQKNSPVIKRVEYQYPNPPAALGGFPARMTIGTLSAGEYKPNLEMNLYSVHLADQRLPHDFFSDDQFKTAKIIYTNTYVNSDVWGTVKPLKGQPYVTNLTRVKFVFPKKP